MRHYYSTEKHITLTHGDIINSQIVYVRFERHEDYSWAYAEGSIPQFSFHESLGFMEVELDELRHYLLQHAYRIWEYAGKDNKESLYEQFCGLSATEISEKSLMCEDPVEEKFYQGILDLKLRYPFDQEQEES